MNADERSRVTSTGKVGTGAELVRVTVTMTRGQHRALKQLARGEGMTVSRLVRKWLYGESRKEPLP